MAEIKEMRPLGTALIDRIEIATWALETLSKDDPHELSEHRGEIAHLFSLACKVWNDAYAPALATRFDSDG